MDRHKTLNSLLFVDALDDISCLHVYQDRVSGILDLVVQALDLAERRLQPIPLRGVLVAALSDGDVVSERRIIAPKRKLLQRWTACEQVEHGADNRALVV